MGSRRAAWRIISSVEQKEKSKGNDTQAGFAKDYRVKVEDELQKICDTILGLLDKGPYPKGNSGRVQGLLSEDEGRLLSLHCGVPQW